MTESDAQARLSARIRRLLAHHDVSERSMFGGRSFLVDGSIAVAARRDGELLVRVDPDRRTELQARAGAGPALMGEREMGDSWVCVRAGAVVTDESLRAWLAEGIEASRPAPT